jgi:hypothetical protein
MELLVTHHHVSFAELASPRLGSAEVDVLEEVGELDHLFAKLAFFRLLVSVFLVVTEILLHGFETAVFAFDGNVFFLFVFFFFCFEDYFSSFAFVAMAEAVSFM